MKRILLLGAVSLFSSFAHFEKISFRDVTATNLPVADLGSNTMDIELADVDGDSDMDIILAMEFRPNVLLINQGGGRFANESAARLPQVAHDSEDIGVGDFDKDGDTDIVFVSEDDKIHEYYINTGKGSFEDRSNAFPVTSICNAVDAGDYDRDGDLDLVLGNDGQEIYLANDGKGNFTDQTRDRLPIDYSVTQDVQSADLDLDGDLDLFIGNENGNRIYINDGSGRFTDETSTRFPRGNEETRKVDLADIDGDGDLDAFLSNVDFGRGRDKKNRLLVNTGKGVFVDETNKQFPVTNDMHTGDVHFADLDGDKDLDLVIANLFGGYAQIALNDGKGKFTEVSDEVFPQKVTGEAISVEVADLNGDGKPDIYFGMFRATDMLLLKN
ncbi:MAG TPA: VCBS repeat-containing protein [Flavisolibacter sp.]|nr:VCBS repeat-containing protein [Flavisolibacter sp.]